MDSAREEILGKVRASLGRTPGSPVAPVPPTARVKSRTAGPLDAEIEQLFIEIGKLNGVARRLASKDDLKSALADLVKAEAVKKATLWATLELQALDVASTLRALGVEIVSPQADKHLVAECELGVTGVDAALPETGTLLLRSSPERPRVVSLLPRVHLALLTPAALRADLHQAFSEVQNDGYCVLVTGPSRTSDIELTLTLGVHGPKSLYAWLLDEP
ncbi:MAG: lactate utilization protein C [Candidatus Methylomirabilales bacterium]